MGPRGGGPLSLPRLPRGSFVYFHSLPLGAYPGRLARFRSLSFGGLVGGLVLASCAYGGRILGWP